MKALNKGGYVLPICERLNAGDWDCGDVGRAAELIADMFEALEHAHAEFIRYAKLHRAKGTDEGDAKACHNASMAEEMHRAIAKALGETP